MQMWTSIKSSLPALAKLRGTVWLELSEARIEYYRLLAEYRALETKRDLYRAELDKYEP